MSVAAKKERPIAHKQATRHPVSTRARVVKAEAGPKRSEVRDSARIRQLVKENPHREGTNAYDYFEAAKGSPTIAEYLAKFPKNARRNVRQGLSNMLNDEHVKLVGV